MCLTLLGEKRGLDCVAKKGCDMAVEDRYDALYEADWTDG